MFTPSVHVLPHPCFEVTQYPSDNNPQRYLWHMSLYLLWLAANSDMPVVTPGWRICHWAPEAVMTGGPDGMLEVTTAGDHLGCAGGHLEMADLSWGAGSCHGWWA